MGQHLSNINSKIVDSVKSSDAKTIETCNGKDDINLFLPVKASISSSIGSSFQSDHERLIKQIQNNLSLLTDTTQHTDFNAQIHKLFEKDIFLSVVTHHTSAIEELKDILTKKFKSSDDKNNKESQVQELSYFIIQSLTSMLLTLIKSTEKNDPTIVYQILTLSGQLCEQMPVKCLSTNDNRLSASLKSLTDYIDNLTLSKDSMLAKQALKVQLGFSIAQGSFKNILPLLSYLIFITDDVFDFRSLFIRLNDDLTVALDNYEKQKQQSISSTETDEDSEQEAGSILLTGTDETPFGIYETIAGGDSSLSTSGNGTGNYPFDESPSNAFDGNTSTKYLNFGNCGFEDAGLRTGLYFTLKRDQSIVTGLRFYTANDCPNRDPLMVTLEGSNQTGELLHLGSSWNLIYNGPSGLATDPGRESRGIKQSFSNSTPYASYRLLITEKRDNENSVQYSKFQLYGYQQQVLDEICTSSLDYLKSIEAFPNEQLIKLDDQRFSGQFISSIIFAHIDIDQEFNSKKQFQSASLNSSMSFEFHPNTFKQLFHIIEQLSAKDSNTAVVHILTVCLRLFTTHLKFLCAVKLNLDDDLEKWFAVLLKLACDEKLDYKAICREASKALIYVIEKKQSSFIEKLAFIHKYTIEQKYPILTEQLLLELNRKVTLLNWINMLCDDKPEKITAMTILYSFIDTYFNASSDISEEQRQCIKQILISFQQLLLARLTIDKSSETSVPTICIAASSVIVEYITYLLSKHHDGEIFNSIMIGLGLMAQVEERFDFDTILPIFTSVLPLLAEYIIQRRNTEEYLHYIDWLFGKMTNFIINGPKQNSLETKHTEKLKSPLFAGGCERIIVDKNPYLNSLLKSNLAEYSQFNIGDQTSFDNEFLMSIYNNVDQGAQLITKLKMYMKNKFFLQKSIEQLANDACAAVFAVYIKHYRRIELAKFELSQYDVERAHNQLISLYEYANHVYTLFATTKAQGGDCNELFNKIKLNTKFLLLSVKESHLIPIVHNDTFEQTMTTPLPDRKRPRFHRQYSRWTKAKYVFRLLRNIMHACIRFKKAMLAKRQAVEQKQDNESILKRTIDAFVYGDIYKIDASMSNEEKQLELDELVQCMSKQYERAMSRLMAYRFIQTFLQKLLNNDDHNHQILTIILPHFRNLSLDWSYLENIEATSHDLKENIRRNYYLIIKTVLSKTSESNLSIRNIFNLLNISYESRDIYYIHHYHIVETIYTSFASCHENISLDLKLIGYNWFRSFVLQLCENIEIEETKGTTNDELKQQQQFIFKTLILNELNASISSNQLLVLLLRCVHSYERVRSVCGTNDYIEELLYIYQNSKTNSTILFALKILRDIIPKCTNETSRMTIKNFLCDILLSIGNSFNSQGTSSTDTINELINIFRTLISSKSSWQMMAIQLLFNSIKSIEIMDANSMNNFLASLCILGGYIEPYCLGSIVKICKNEEKNEFDVGVIIEIKMNTDDSNDTSLPYLVQYSQTNKTEWVNVDKLRIEVSVSPPNLFSLPNMIDSDENIHSLLDILGYFIQIDTSTIESLPVLQIKRRSVAVLCELLNEKKIVEIFMQKPYASTIAKLSISEMNHSLPNDLRLFNKQHLEQYCLSLDTYQRSKQIVEDSHTKEEITNDSFSIWNKIPIDRNQLIVEALTTNSMIYNGWKPYASKEDIQLYKQGRIGGSDELSIVPMPPSISDPNVFEESGNKHKLKGRITPTGDNTRVSFPTYIVNNIRLTKGNWYYCVKFRTAGLIQIGWATNRFTPIGDSSKGVGDDEYSWSYEGSQGTLYHATAYKDFTSDDIRSNDGDVCGCGIEIDGENTKIKYWLNGKFLGTAFAHQCNILTTTTKCNLLPNGRDTIYFPAVSSQAGYYGLSYELIFSPEDMIECPLPKGYKPLLMPKLINIENSIVSYPYSAYLIGNNVQDYFTTVRSTMASTPVLRDFINEQHLQTTFTVEDYQLRLPENSDGFSFSLDNCSTSLTISFDFEIQQEVETDILLCTLDTQERFSVQIPLSKVQGETHAVIIFHWNEQNAKIYLNNQCQTYNGQFSNQTMFEFHILPKIAAKIKNLAIWKYALPEEHIRRLFTYGLSYVAIDYQQLSEYRKGANTFMFVKNQQYFSNGLLLPFNQPFEESIWLQKKKQIDSNESHYFRTINKTDECVIELFGNQSYLVLEKSIDSWSQYTFIFDILCPSPINGERLTLIRMNSKSEIYITQAGKICLSINEKKKTSESILKLNEYIRLVISVHEESVKIYANGLLMFTNKPDRETLTITSNRVDLFRETDLTRNTTSCDALRIECKSITFINRSLADGDLDEQMKSPKYSLESLVALPFSLIASSLVAIGYNVNWIKSVMKQYKTENIQLIDTWIRETKEELQRKDLEDRRKHYFTILSRLNSSIDRKKIEDLLTFSNFDTDGEITTAVELMITHCKDLRLSEPLDNTNWYRETVASLDINENLHEWMQDKHMGMENTDLFCQLSDLTSVKNQRKRIQKSMKYSHQQISQEQYVNSRIACEHGLISIYAHYTVLNMMKVWSNDNSSLFPLEKFGDCAFIVTLLYTYTSTNIDENIDLMSVLVKSILRNEIKELLQLIITTTNVQNKTNSEILSSTAPLLYQLQKDIMVQSIRLLSEPSLLLDDFSSNEETMIKKPNLNFIYKILQLFVELITNKSIVKQDEIDSLIPLLLPLPLINIMFDLFLSDQAHQSKVFILHLFLTLIQASKTFHSTERIQNFLFQLFIELSSNETTTVSQPIGILHLTVMDFIFVLYTKQQSEQRFIFDTQKFPKMFRDILTTIDVIQALTDRTKQTPFPEAFILQVNEPENENLRLTRDDIEKSKNHFDGTADQQLMNFMNKELFANKSIDVLLQRLPEQSAPDATFYKNYPILSNIPALDIRTRAKLLYQFGTLIEKVVPLLDFSLSEKQNILIDRIKTAKLYFAYSTKVQWLEELLSKTDIQYSSSAPQIYFDTVIASTSVNKEESTMFSQAFEQLHKDAHTIFRNPSNQLWTAQYIGMHSTDQGGPYRDSITSICSDICSTRLSLFILCPNGRTNSGLNRDRWIPNVFPPNKPISNRLQSQYQFIGQLMGIAIRKKHYMNFNFPQLLWKQLAGENVIIEDIEAIDMQSFTFINEMEQNMKQNRSIDNDTDINYLFSSIMNELRFDIVSSAGQTYELVPGGSEIPITANNFQEYCSRYREYRLNEFSRQIEFIRRGLYSVVPGYYLNLFTASELEESVCGKGEIDIEILKRNTQYDSSFNENSPHIQRFWKVLSEMFNEEQKKQFLIFTWGRSTLPMRDEDFTSKFTISEYSLSSDEVDKALPRSHTCFFTIDLPEYSTTEIMYERLNYAITNCSSIDGDGNMNEAPG